MQSTLAENRTRNFALNPNAAPFIPQAESHASCKSAPSTRRDTMLDKKVKYQEFTKYLLTREQLRFFGFPEEDPTTRGHAVFRTGSLQKGNTKRTCCRCRSSFSIMSDGSYLSETTCRYHSQKPLPYREDRPYDSTYPCCNGNNMSQGCNTQQYHVTAESALHDVKFERTEAKNDLTEEAALTVYALDCEMVYTTSGMEVAKVGIVDLDCSKVFESFVQPQNQILDYNTTYSGITEKDLKDVSVRLVDVQRNLLNLLNKESILVGHGLENDLKALRLIHQKIVDTSVVYLPQNTESRKSLKSLAHDILEKEIQQSPNSHDCIEDASTCMELMLHKINLNDRPRIIEDDNHNYVLPTINQPDEFAVCEVTVIYLLCGYLCFSDGNIYPVYLMQEIYINPIYG